MSFTTCLLENWIILAVVLLSLFSISQHWIILAIILISLLGIITIIKCIISASTSTTAELESDISANIKNFIVNDSIVRNTSSHGLKNVQTTSVIEIYFPNNLRRLTRCIFNKIVVSVKKNLNESDIDSLNYIKGILSDNKISLEEYFKDEQTCQDRQISAFKNIYKESYTPNIIKKIVDFVRNNIEDEICEGVCDFSGDDMKINEFIKTLPVIETTPYETPGVIETTPYETTRVIETTMIPNSQIIDFINLLPYNLYRRMNDNNDNNGIGLKISRKQLVLDNNLILTLNENGKENAVINMNTYMFYIVLNFINTDDNMMIDINKIKNIILRTPKSDIGIQVSKNEYSSNNELVVYDISGINPDFEIPVPVVIDNSNIVNYLSNDKYRLNGNEIVLKLTKNSLMSSPNLDLNSLMSNNGGEFAVWNFPGNLLYIDKRILSDPNVYNNISKINIGKLILNVKKINDDSSWVFYNIYSIYSDTNYISKPPVVSEFSAIKQTLEKYIIATVDDRIEFTFNEYIYKPNTPYLKILPSAKENRGMYSMWFRWENSGIQIYFYTDIFKSDCPNILLIDIDNIRFRVKLCITKCPYIEGYCSYEYISHSTIDPLSTEVPIYPTSTTAPFTSPETTRIPNDFDKIKNLLDGYFYMFPYPPTIDSNILISSNNVGVSNGVLSLSPVQQNNQKYQFANETLYESGQFYIYLTSNLDFYIYQSKISAFNIPFGINKIIINNVEFEVSDENNTNSDPYYYKVNNYKITAERYTSIF